MRRREFISLLGGAAAVWPLAARAQQGERMRRVVVINSTYQPSDREWQARIAAFADALQKLGWTNGRNVRIEYRSETPDIERIKELVRSAPDVIVVISNPLLAELHRLTSTIPIVFAQVSDPVDAGFVASLSRPGGNITGFQNFELEMGGKWLGMLKEAAPNLSRVAVLYGSDVTANVGFLRTAEAVAPSLGITLTPINVYADSDVERTVAAFASSPDGGLLVMPHPLIVTNRGSIIVLAARYRLPAIYPYRFFSAEGGLLSYGPDQIEQWRSAASYIDRILRGEKPADLPVVQSTRFEFVINLNTAKALGIEVPPTLSARADEVIE
jgi:putative ABC transport system substrate-binding protein